MADLERPSDGECGVQGAVEAWLASSPALEKARSSLERDLGGWKGERGNGFPSLWPDWLSGKQAANQQPGTLWTS